MTTNRVRTKRGMRRHKPDRQRAINRIVAHAMRPMVVDQLYGESILMRRLRERRP